MSRRFYRVTDVSALTNIWNIPATGYREEFGAPYRTAVRSIVGTDGGFDSHGDGRAPLDPGRVRVNLELLASCGSDLQAKITTMLTRLEGTRTTGRRKLWRWEQVGQSSRRWTYCRLTNRPSMSRNLITLPGRMQPVGLDFVLPEPFFYEALTAKWLTDNGYTAFDASAITSQFPEPVAPDWWLADLGTVNATPTTFTITNNGDRESRRLFIYLDSNAAAGYTNPKFENLTTGQVLRSTTDAADANGRLSINPSIGLSRAQVSADNGGSWSDDTPNLFVEDLVGGNTEEVFELAPGDNTIRYTDGGAPNFELKMWWLHAYRD